MPRTYVMTAGAVIDAEGRTVVNGVVSIYDALTGGTVIAPGTLRQADGSAWPIEGVKTDGNGAVRVLWPDTSGDPPDMLYVDSARGRWEMPPADLSARLTEVIDAAARVVDGVLVDPDGDPIEVGGEVTPEAINDALEGADSIALPAGTTVGGQAPAVLTGDDNGDGTGTVSVSIGGTTFTWAAATGATPPPDPDSPFTSDLNFSTLPDQARFTDLTTLPADPSGPNWQLYYPQAEQAYVKSFRQAEGAGVVDVESAASRNNGVFQERTTPFGPGSALVGTFARFGPLGDASTRVAMLWWIGTIGTGFAVVGVHLPTTGTPRFGVYTSHTGVWQEFSPTGATWASGFWDNPDVLGVVEGPAHVLGLWINPADSTASKLYWDSQSFTVDLTGVAGTFYGVGTHTSASAMPGTIAGDAQIIRSRAATSATAAQVLTERQAQATAYASLYGTSAIS